MGRAGRGGDQAVCVFLRKKGERTPREMKPYLKQDTSACLKKGMIEIFSLKNPDGESVFFIFLESSTKISSKLQNSLLSVVYHWEEEDSGCSEACIEAGWCQCSKCRSVSPMLIHHSPHWSLTDKKCFEVLQQVQHIVPELSLG